MAKVVYICFRKDNDQCNKVTESLRKVDERLRGDNLESRLRVLESGDGVFAGCIHYSEVVKTVGCSVGVGYISDQTTRWSTPGSAEPEGTHAVFRGSKTAVELVSDVLATRSIWYFHDEEWFLASNSQRALVMFLGAFEPNFRPIPWMLANGVTGPDGGWDARFKRVPAGGRVRLDRTSWRLTCAEEPCDFGPKGLRDGEHRAMFREAVEESVRAFSFDTARWVLPLSGGYDSRLLACLLRDRKGLRTVTWGMSPVGDERDSEGAVARQLADALGLEHQYLLVQLGEEPLETVMDRFVRMSEGRTDGLGGYLDGFRMWADLANSGVDGIIRGDEAFGGFGWSPVYSERDVRLGLGLGLLADLPSTAWLSALDGMEQRFPVSFAQLPGESLETWRSRLYHEYRVPVALSALNETKAAFVEIVNPLQFRRVVEVVRGLPDHLRTDKHLLIDLVKRMSPNVPYANVREGDQLLGVLRQKGTISFLKRELQSEAARSVLSDAILTGLVERLPGVDSTSPDSDHPLGYKKRMEEWARATMPHALKRRLKRFIPAAPLDPCLLAFRAWIVVRIHQLLEEDAKALCEHAGLNSALSRDTRH